jgi:dihydroorotate dehydrogenase electron transfer subunit
VPVDIDAEVIANTPLSADYNVLALAAPEIASIARPGQFVMVKARPGFEPLLRRPFSVFELFRHPSGAATGLSILNKRIGVSTNLLYEARLGQRIAVLGPLGKSFTLVAPPVEAWLVAGGVGLRHALLWRAQCGGTLLPRLFHGARGQAGPDHRRRKSGRTGPHHHSARA